MNIHRMLLLLSSRNPACLSLQTLLLKPLKQAKLKDLQSYVQGLVPDNIFHLYWAPILNAVPSADNNVDDDEPFANLVDYD